MSGFGHGNWMTGNYLWKAQKGDSAQSSAIMQSLDENPSLNNSSVTNQSPKSNESLSLHGANSSILENSNSKSEKRNHLRSFLLIDDRERLKVSNLDQFLIQLHCPNRELKVKVVSIFGNTGDGKSHTLNHTFFDGAEVFRTFSEQNSCTMGVWAAYDPKLSVICLDTEGLLGVSCYEMERTRLLLKVLAISDIVVYRTRAERLHRDMFTFLGSASRAYSHYFTSSLQEVTQRQGMGSSGISLGPSIMIFHETRHTTPLSNAGSESAEDILRERFTQTELEIDAFSSIKYVGVQTNNPPTNYEPLRTAIENELRNTTVRSARKPQLVYSTLKVLNDKFSGEMPKTASIPFPDQYFTCPMKCLSCMTRCQNSMGHIREGKPHASDTSRQHWFGNKKPEDAAVRTNINHVWGFSDLLTSQNTAQRVVDGVSYLTEAVASVTLQPSKMFTDWVTDAIAPQYWRANSEIQHCHKCKVPFGPTDKKHHCRSCGQGVCASCSSKTKCVPDRGWHTPVRVCDDCYERDANSNEESGEGSLGGDVSARKVTETVFNTLTGTVGTVLSYSKSIIKDTARPSYWVPDSEVTNCCCCEARFDDTLPLHHCRDCGRGVCADCSTNRKPVPRRGWDNPVRICDNCAKMD